jgi:hypothetical protein
LLNNSVHCVSVLYVFDVTAAGDSRGNENIFLNHEYEIHDSVKVKFDIGNKSVFD